MKTRVFTLLLTFSSIAFGYAQEKLVIDVKKSEVKWNCDYTFYFNGHNGLINFKEGYFTKSNEVIIGGEFIIDMNSITCLDIDKQDSNESLVNHLKDPDFFNVEQYETAALKINSVKYHDKKRMQIFADLTIKGITNPISFQAEVDYKEKTMTTKFKIDRTLWGVNYNSNMKDGAISEAIGFEVILSL
ncbi:YceI family protein [Psychroserpens sp. Hel_I_66]|uniref:YceI family protein n=1 Tax=Psychroserpens sp. Hel_I_66 TaxID=1250004 RepID=UPI00068D6C0B|nr:YceI family protein [Psychroserpens sp. Hel_I_66]